MTKAEAEAILVSFETEAPTMPALPLFWERMAGLCNFKIKMQSLLDHYSEWHVSLESRKWIKIIGTRVNQETIIIILDKYLL